MELQNVIIGVRQLDVIIYLFNTKCDNTFCSLGGLKWKNLFWFGDCGCVKQV